MRKISSKGYRVIHDEKGRPRVERIPYYGLDASAKSRAKKSKKMKPIRAQLNFSPARAAQAEVRGDASGAAETQPHLEKNGANVRARISNTSPVQVCSKGPIGREERRSRRNETLGRLGSQGSEVS